MARCYRLHRVPDSEGFCAYCGSRVAPAWALWALYVLFPLCGIALAASLVFASRPPEVVTLVITATPPAVVSATPTLQPFSDTLEHTPTDMPTATLLPSETPWPGQSVPMALIPAGAFQMGGDADAAVEECKKLDPGSSCDRAWFADEEPIHTVTLKDFYIDVYEVTNARYQECVQSGACSAPSESKSATRDSYYSSSQFADYPVIYVSWDDAKAYCEWRGARLPTEAEWEKAARGGLEGKLYPWGDGFDGSRVNFCDKNCPYSWANKSFDDGYADTAPVGTYPSNGYGLYDMAGNVWEWTADWYAEEYYASSPAENPTGPASGQYRALRGGSWYYVGYNVRASYRYGYSPSNQYNDTGFRCAFSP